MTSAGRRESGAGLSPEDIRRMEKYGLKRVPADHFVVGSYRYTSLEDAIAQAERRLRSDASA